MRAILMRDVKQLCIPFAQQLRWHGLLSLPCSICSWMHHASHWTCLLHVLMLPVYVMQARHVAHASQLELTYMNCS